MEKLYTVSKTRPGANCGSDHELLIAKFRLKLKKVGKTTRPFRYAAAVKLLQSCPTLCGPIDSSLPGSSVPGILQTRILEWVQVWPNDYTVEVRNRFKGLDLIECLKNYGWRFMTLFRGQGSRPFPRKRKQKDKMVVWGGLTNSWERREVKSKGERKDTLTWRQSSKEQ